MTTYLQNSLSRSTISTYCSGTRSFVAFTGMLHISPFPPTENVLCLFVTHLAQRHLSHRSIKVYLHGIQFHSLLHGFPIEFSSMPFLYYTIRGIRRTQGDSLTRSPRDPITVQHLWQIFAFLSASQFHEFDKCMWRSAVLTAFFGLLRVSEYTCSGTFDASIHLSADDVSFNVGFTIMYIRIKGSKTDPFRSGTTIRLAAISNHALCPVRAMRAYLAIRPPSRGPLFALHNGVCLTRRFIVAFLRVSLPSVDNINTHSFRIGGASAAFAAGASDELIRIMGRWSSNCFRRYLRITDRSVLNFHDCMSKATSTKPWSPDSY